MENFKKDVISLNANENKNNLDNNFSLKKLFSSLKKSDAITEKDFLTKLKSFEKSNSEWYKIFKTLLPLLKKIDVDSTKDILAFSLLIQNLQATKWKKTEAFLRFLINISPAKVKKLIDGLSNKVLEKKDSKENNDKIWNNDKNNLEKLVDQVNEEPDNFQKFKNEANTFSSSMEKKSNNSLEEIVNDEKLLRKEVEKIKKLISQLPDGKKYEKQIKTQAEKLHQTYPEISSDQAYLLVFANTYENNPELQKTLKLSDQELAIMKVVEQKFSYLAKAMNFVKIDNNFKQETEQLANNYDDKLENSIELKDLKLKNEYVLKILKIGEFDKIAQDDLKNKYDDFVKYLEKKEISSENDKSLFEQEKQKLFKNYINSFQKEYFSSYKLTAMKVYLDEVFWLFDKTLQSKYVEKAQNGFETTKNWIKINFKYRDVPLTFNVENDGKIKLKSFAKVEKWAYKVWEQQVNEVFTFTSLNELFTPEKVNPLDFLDKDWKLKLKDTISKNVSKKVEKNNALGNAELMKTETLFNIKQEFITYNLLRFYKPPFEDLLNYEAWNSSLTENSNPSLYKLMTYSLRTINFKENGEDVLTKLFTSSNLNQFLDRLDKDSFEPANKNMSTFLFFDKLNLISKIDGTFNIKKLTTFIKAFDKKDIKLLEEKFPLEWYKWELKNNKIILKENKDEFADIDETILSKLNPAGFIKNDLA